MILWNFPCCSVFQCLDKREDLCSNKSEVGEALSRMMSYSSTKGSLGAGSC